ncbi:MAG: hypothetical protein ACFE9C_08475 [Candidatus Hodarchaeota archaeon]
MTLIVISFNTDLIIKIRDYHITKNYQIDYPNGSGGVNVDSSLSIGWNDLYFAPDVFTRNFYINLFSKGDVTHVGLNSINYDVFVNEVKISVQTINWNPTVLSFSEGPNDISLGGNDNLTYKGFVNASFNVENTIKSEVIYFQVSSLISLYTLEIQLIHFWRYCFGLFEIGSFIFLFYALYRILKIGALPLHLTKEMVQKDKEYFDFLRKWNKDKNQTNKTQELENKSDHNF